jgi:hypothetical protein
MDLLDPAGEGSQPVCVGRRRELVEVLASLGEQADVDSLSTEIQSGVQH